MEENELKFGDVLPILRIAVSGTTKGPGVFEMMALIGKEEVGNRMQTAFAFFETL
jgi:glutamyl-tRNA synthetase